MRVGNESKLEFRGCDTDLDPMLIAKQQKEGEKKAKCGKGRCQQVLVKRSGEDCGTELEVTSLAPLTVEEAPEVEEDWGE